MALLTYKTQRVLALSLPILIAIGCSKSDDSSNEQLLIGAASEEISEFLNGPTRSYGPFDDAAQAVFDSYTGNNERAEFSDANADSILDMVLFGPLSAGDNKLFSSGYLSSTLMRHSPGGLVGLVNSTEPDYQLCANSDGSGLMNWGVSEITPRDETLRIVNLTYTNCLMEGKFIDGAVVFASGSAALNNGVPAHYFEYDNVSVSHADSSTWVFNGVEAFPAGASCDAAGAALGYFSAENTDSGTTWLFENLETTLYSDDAGTRCAALFSDDADETVYSTILAHSEYGVVNVSQDRLASNPGHAVQIAGAEGNALEFKKEFQTLPSDVDSTDLQVHIDAVAFAEVTGLLSGVEQDVVSQALSAVRLGGLLPMSDSDADGLTDGYELAYVLEESDANDDLDQDGLTTLEELAAGSNPTDVRDNGWLVDRQITVLSSQSGAGSTVQEFYVSIGNQGSRLSSGDFDFTVSLSGGATFASTEATSTPTFDFFGNTTTFADVACEYTNDALNELQCRSGSDEVCTSFGGAGQSAIECENNLLLQRKFAINAVAGESVTITADLLPHAQERNVANNITVSD